MISRIGSGWLSLGLFLIGVAVGWFIIGWWLWPMSGGARPADLTSVYQQDYLALVADSYALNGNVNIAKQRLQGFDLTKIAPDLDTLAQASEKQGQTAQAARMRNLVAAIARGDLGPVSGLQITPSTKTTVVTPQPTAAPASGGILDQLGDALASLRRSWLIIVVLALVALALAIWAWQRWQLAAAPGVSTVREVVQGAVLPGRRSSRATPEATPVYVTLNQLTRISYTVDGPDRTDVRVINPSKSVIGQVELRVSEILRAHPSEPPASLELRLLDRLDRRTVVGVLVSHEAAIDTTARQLIESMPSDVMKPPFDVSRTGRVVVLDTRYIRLQAEVIEVNFEPGSRYPTFSDLVLAITPISTDTTTVVDDEDDDDLTNNDDDADTDATPDEDDDLIDEDADEDEDEGRPSPPPPPRRGA